MNIPSVEELLKSGVHFGHRTSKWHPNMAPYIFTSRNNVHIIDVEQTHQLLETALKTMTELVAAGKSILFVGTKRQAAGLVKKHAEIAGMPYVTTRWLGGLLTNFPVVSQVPAKLVRLKTDTEAGNLTKYTKKEQLLFSREIDRLEIIVGGIADMTKLPDALFIVDPVQEDTALREANRLNIPVFALCDTNCNPRDIQYPIPANDDGIKSLELLLGTISSTLHGVERIAPVTDTPVAAAAPETK